MKIGGIIDISLIAALYHPTPTINQLVSIILWHLQRQPL